MAPPGPALQREPDFRAIVRGLPRAVLLLWADPPAFPIAEASEAFLALVGANRDHVVGRPVFVAFPRTAADPDSRGEHALREAMARVIATRTPVAIVPQERSGLRPDGTWVERWLLPSFHPLVGRGGVVEMLLHEMEDITASHRAEQALRLLAEAGQVLSQSLEIDRTLQVSTRLALPLLGDFCAVDLLPEGADTLSGSGAVRVASAHVLPEKEALMLEYARQFAPGERNRYSPAARVVRTGKPLLLGRVDLEAAVRELPDPVHRRLIRAVEPKSLLSVPLVAHGAVIGAITFGVSESPRQLDSQHLALAAEFAGRAALAIDSARLFAAEAAARRSADLARRTAEEHAAEVERARDEARESASSLERANVELARLAEMAGAASRTKSEFLAMMSHELRTPLNAIAGYVDLLEAGMFGRLSDQQMKQLERVRLNQRHLLLLIERILEFSWLEAGGTPMETELLDVNELLSDLDAISSQARAKGVDLALDLGSCRTFVRADRRKLRHVVLDLIDNAVKFTPEGGSVVARCRLHGRDLLIEVQDTGVGIPQGLRESVFEPFRQADEGLTRLYGGAGLGLTIARAFARRMGGDLTVRNAPGTGSIFTLRLPIGEEGAGSS